MTRRCLILALLLLAAISPAPAAQPAKLAQSALGNIFVAGEPVAIPVHGGHGNLRWSIRDFFGTEVASGVTPASGETTLLRLQIPTLGYFTLQITVEDGGQAAAQIRTALAVVPPPSPGDRASPFGVMTHFAKGWPTDIIPLIEKAGIRHVRDEQPWRQVERQRAQYTFPPRLSAYMSELAAHHLDPLIVLAFSNPLYDGDQTPFSDAGRAGYAAYARAVAARYGPSVSAVEIWNEYNGSFCAGPCRSDRPSYYSSMLRESYKSLKAVNPSLIVLGGAAVPIPLDYLGKLFEQGALEAMDAVVIHPYRAQPEGVEQQIESLRQVMTRYGTSKPIWATEFGDLADMRKSRDDVARYLVRMSVLLLSAKVERVYWYLMRDYQEFTGLGLVRDEGDPLGRYAPTPAYAAYATLIHQLDGVGFVRREASDPATRIYLFADGKRQIRVLWSALPGATYDVESEKPLRRVSMMGDEKRLTPQGGRISVTLDQNPFYLVGGAP